MNSKLLSRSFFTTLLAGITLLAVATAPALAEVYTVRMKSGTEFLSKYEPRQAYYSEDKLLLMTKAGNIIALDKADIEEITSTTEDRGFGTVIDTTTILVGTRPNDAPVLDDDAINQAIDRASRIQSLRGPAAPQNFSSPLFSEPNGGGGLPVGFLNTVTPPIGNPPR